MQTIRRCAAVAALLLAAAAHAQSEDEPLLATSRENWPTEITRRPLTLAGGMFEITAPLTVDVSSGADWSPWLLAPTLYFGVNDHWMLGVRHLSGLCLGSDSDCGTDKYNDVSVESVLSVGRGGGLDAALGLAVNYAPIDPATWSGEARLLLRAGGGAFAFTLAPTVNFGFNDRDTRIKWSGETFNLGTYNLTHAVAFASAANREVLLVPLTVQLQLGKTLAIAAGSALEGPLNPLTGDFGDYYQIPLQGGAMFTPTPWIDLGASITFLNAFGKETNDTNRWDNRLLTFFAAFRI
jgi:hypothetical protein